MPITKFIAVGPHAGKTVLLAHFQFVEGVYTFDGSDEEAVLVGRTLENQYSAYREDRAPAALERYDAMIAEEALTEKVPTPSMVEGSVKERRVAERFLIEKLSPVMVYGEGEAANRILALMQEIMEEQAPSLAEILADMMAKATSTEPVEPVVVEPIVPALVEPIVPAIVEPIVPVVPEAPVKPTTVLGALQALDPKNDQHWTARGVPSVDAVASILARAVTRSEIEEAAPDLTRSTAANK